VSLFLLMWSSIIKRMKSKKGEKERKNAELARI